MSKDELTPQSETLADNVDQGRFELYRQGALVAWLYYTHLKPNRYALQHTEVQSGDQHQGVGSAMVRRVLEEVRTRRGTTTAICPFVVDYLSRATTFVDLIDPQHPGYSNSAAAEGARVNAGG